jgi:hypothetical protein
LNVLLRSAESQPPDGHRAWDDGAASGTPVPEQLRRDPTAAAPEYALLRAILVQALRDLRRVRGVTSRDGSSSRNSRRRSPARDAEAWFTDTDTSWPCSFENVCAVLDLDADSVRRRVGIPTQSDARRVTVSRRRRTAATVG